MDERVLFEMVSGEGEGWLRGMLKGWRGNTEKMMRMARWGLLKFLSLA